MEIFYLKKISIINILLILKINESNTIKFKIKTLKYYQNYSYLNEEYKDNYLYYDFIFNNIYTDIKIGEPPQNVRGFISGQMNEFNIVHEKCFINNSKYNRTNSITFNNLTFYNITHKDYKYGCFAKENFQFEQFIDDKNKENKEIYFNQLKFFLPDDFYIKDKNNVNSCVIIGLKMNNKDLFKETPKNFIYYLMEYFSEIKKKKLNNNYILNNYYWTIKYNKENDNDHNNFISIGDPPHIYDPENYKSKKFLEFNIQSLSLLYWNIFFDEIYITKSNSNITNDNKFSNIYLQKYFGGHNCLFYPEINSFFSTIEYFNLIKKEFFGEFFSKNICYEKKIYLKNSKLTVIDNIGGNFKIIFCNKNKIEEYGEQKFYSEFPSLNFYHQLSNTNFSFNGNELFFDDKNENIYFLICVKQNSVDSWVFGKVFMKKYQIIFNSEFKTIGFYLDNEKINSIDNKYKRNNKDILIIVIILGIVLSIIITVLLLNKYKNVFVKNKKILVEELEMINKNDKFI